MMRIIGMVLLAACGLLVLRAEGFHWIALWNLLPLFVAGVAIARGTAAGRISWAAVAFAAVTALSIAFVHAAWELDWGATRTGASTAGLIFLFAPIAALLLGACGWAAARTAAAIILNRRQP